MVRRLLALSLLAACAADPGTTTVPGGGGKADGNETTLAFTADFKTAQDGALVAGSPVRVSYDLARMTACKSDAFAVTGHAQFDVGAPVTFAVSRLAAGAVAPIDAEVALPAAATHVALWFEISDRYGCHAFDSNGGANYPFAITPRAAGPVLAFAADFTTSSSGALHAGDRAVIDYAPERLAACAAESNGRAAWSVTAHWQVDGGEVFDVLVTRSDGAAVVASDPQVAIPRGHDLAVWFDATNVWGCHAYDSAYGANYHFAIE